MDCTCSKNGYGRTVKNIFESKSEGSRRRGRRKIEMAGICGSAGGEG